MEIDLTTLLNLQGVVVEFENSTETSICFNLLILNAGIHCPHCRNHTTELHQVRPILVRDLPAFGKEVYLKLPRRQFYCRFCQRYITEQLKFIDWRRKYTKRYEESIYQQVNNSSIEQVAQKESLSIEQVKNIFNYVSHKTKNSMVMH